MLRSASSIIELSRCAQILLAGSTALWVGDVVAGRRAATARLLRLSGGCPHAGRGRRRVGS